MKVAVFFGGKSCEHNISIITGVQAMRVLQVRHEVIPIYIDNEGAFWTGKDLTDLKSFKSDKKIKKQKVVLAGNSKNLYSAKGKILATIDVALLCTHGFGGEDGCLQGLLSLCGIPFTGSSVLASSVGMNKIYMKKMFERDFLPIVPYVSFSKNEYKNDLYSLVEKIKTELKFPMIVKPASLGSSIGISVAHDFPELFESISNGFLWDNEMVVENALVNYSEYNCAGIGDENDIVVSEIERPISSSEILTYKDKYQSKQKGQSGAKKEFPAKIDEKLAEKIKSLTKRVFKSIGASGVARVDFLLGEDGQIYVNEINTIPGALSNYLFSKGVNKLSFADLLDRLLDIAVIRQKRNDELQFVYKSTYSI